MNIVLIGMPGAGKSTLGVLLAKRMNLGFADVDLLIQQGTGRKLQEIIDEDGLAAFWAIERDTVLRFSPADTVVATGGSAVLDDDAAKHLRSLGPVLYLEVPKEELFPRLTNLATRGIAMKKGETIEDVYAYREPIYRKWADATVDAHTGTPWDAVLRMEEAVKKLSGS